MVLKRFFRNRLSVVGLIIIICMFIFAFIGGAINPYTESEIFYTTEEMSKDYAGVTVVEENQIYAREGVFLPDDIHSKISLAIMNKEMTFKTNNGDVYELFPHTDDSFGLYKKGEMIALVCKFSFSPYQNDEKLDFDFYRKVLLAIQDEIPSFELEGRKETFAIESKNGQYEIKRYQTTRVIDIYAKPSKEHWLGTDGNGMDILTRLMYGGRISLLIGFVVVLIELLIGVVIGGIAGFFGGWVDNILMRFVDVVYCIPAMPLYLFLGSVMDYYDISSTTRVYMLCLIMAIIGWVGIARIVRGQILSLREQEFMLAAEATGIRVHRRIFKHLLPNVVPQLIVFSSMGLGEIILSEAALSFLGLGVKFPAASWGSMINSVNDAYVMRNYLWVWVPAGVLILLTVLAFNFVGDGLRDAFDPKMKR